MRRLSAIRAAGAPSTGPAALPSPFDAQLVNGPFGDPALYVDLLHGRRAFLLDAGDLTALGARRLLRVTDILISHAHMDHWSGFDHFLRLALGRERTVRLFGPPGTAERLDHKLRAHSWNLLGGYVNELAFEVTEIGEHGPAARAIFRLRDGFAREPLAPVAGPAILADAQLRVTAAMLDHGIPCLAYAIEERAHVNVWKSRLAELGLGLAHRDRRDQSARRHPGRSGHLPGCHVRRRGQRGADRQPQVLRRRQAGPPSPL
ncbi:MAG: MBL fold metallo-hydrolase [Geminicoccaceae bacterium]